MTVKIDPFIQCPSCPWTEPTPFDLICVCPNCATELGPMSPRGLDLSPGYTHSLGFLVVIALVGAAAYVVMLIATAVSRH